MWTRRAVLASGLALSAGLLLPARSFATTDQLRIALPAEPPHLDPTAEPSAATMQVSFQNLFEGLTQIEQDGGVKPGLAKSWTISDDRLTYRFALQPEVRYHDGTSFDADHVVFSLNRLRDPASGNPQRALFAAISKVTAIDPATVAIVLTEADDRLLFNLGRGEAAMVAPESADNNRTTPIGTGPFALTQWDQGQSILFERNEDYWGVHPRVNEAILTFIAASTTSVEAMLGRQIDGCPVIADPGVLAPVSSNPALRITTGKGPDGRPRVGVWNSELSGMWIDAPVEGCPLAGIRWAGDTGPAEVGPAPFITNSD